MAVIYGVDTQKPYSASDVRDAIVECFTQAHDEVLKEELKDSGRGLDSEEFYQIKKLNVQQLIRQYFKEVGGDYEKPTKESLVPVCDKLAELASHYRDPKIIIKHYSEIIQLVHNL